MKKKKSLSLRIASLVLFSLMFVEFISPASHASAAVLEQAADTMYAIRSETSLSLYDTLMSEIKDGDTYREDYAGTYMDSQGNLVICVTESQSAADYRTILTEQVIASAVETSRADVKANYSTIGSGTNINSNDLIRYEVKPYSYNDLYYAQDVLYDKMKEFKIAETRISDKDCNLTIATLDDSLRNTILEYLESVGGLTDFIIFEHADHIVQSHATIYAGQECSVLSSSGTVGFAATYNGQYGIVTAAHVVGDVNNSVTVYDSNGNRHTGTVTYSSMGYVMDAAFVALTDGVTVSSKTKYNDYIRDSNGTASVVQGVEIIRVGKETGYTTGTVTNSSVTVTSDSGTYRDFFSFSSSTTCLHGDSGGPIAIRENNKLLGIYHGTGNYLYVACKYTNINERGISYVDSATTF